MKLRKLIAGILTIALLMQILPATIFATEGEAGESAASAEELAGETASGTAEAADGILFEVTELRFFDK